jgi:tetratricopeptide (TPR) repeat protein
MNRRFGTQSPATQDPARCFAAGLVLLKREELRQAILAFETAHQGAPENPLYMSYLGLALTLARSRGLEGLRLCEAATRRGQYYPEVFRNLGNVYLTRGNRMKARLAFLHGLKIDGSHPGLLSDIAELGIRRTPPIPFLARSHSLNRCLGKTLHQLHLW